MDSISLKAPAKINLCLDITGRRKGGYHTIESVMQSIALGDTVRISLRESGISIECGADYIPNDRRNTAWKAANAFFSETAPGGAVISIEKTVPVGAGLGGGSADAAAVLLGLNELYGFPLSREELIGLGAKVGADVPFCLMGGAALTEGIGEILTPLPAMPDCTLLICKPPYGCSTQELYARSDRTKITERPKTGELIEALKAGDLERLSRRMFNVFESLLPERSRDIFAIKSVMLDKGALASVMTGSGSAIFGVFTSQEGAEEARQELMKDGNEAYCTEPLK